MGLFFPISPHIHYVFTFHPYSACNLLVMAIGEVASKDKIPQVVHKFSQRIVKTIIGGSEVPKVQDCSILDAG